MNTPLNGGVAVGRPNEADPSIFAGARTAAEASTSTSNRLMGIDAARGIAMLLVCLSHVRHHFQDYEVAYASITAFTRSATPTFLLLSGFVAAYVLGGRKSGVRIAVIDRALFVLIAGHLMLNLEQLREVGLQAWLFGRVTVTDAIGLCLIVGALCINLPARVLAITGVVLALISWPIAATITSGSGLDGYILVALFNTRSDYSNLVDAAIVPYLAVFLVGMALSKWSKDRLLSRDVVALARKLFVIGAIMSSCVLFALLVWHELKGTAFDVLADGRSELLRQTLNPWQKLPPSPGYLMFYSGVALLIAAACLAARPRVIVQPIVNWTAVIGRTSLMCFVLQDWLLITIPRLLGFDGISSIPFWIIYLIAVVLTLHWAASQWDRLRANRFLTLGLKSLAANRNSSKPVPARAEHRFTRRS